VRYLWRSEDRCRRWIRFGFRVKARERHSCRHRDIFEVSCDSRIADHAALQLVPTAWAAPVLEKSAEEPVTVTLDSRLARRRAELFTLLPQRPLRPRTGDADSCTRSPSYLPRHGSSRCSISCRARRGSCRPGARIFSFSPDPWFVLLFPFSEDHTPGGYGFQNGDLVQVLEEGTRRGF
jgi:hypothetical protein